MVTPTSRTMNLESDQRLTQIAREGFMASREAETRHNTHRTVLSALQGVKLPQT